MFALLAIVVLGMGLYPAPFTDTMQTSVADLLLHVAQTKLP
jgi:NADH-quinone oxidoreductase subunit M